MSASSKGAERPAAPAKSRSFTRYEPNAALAPSRSRASTLSDAATGPPMLPPVEDTDDSQTPTATHGTETRKESTVSNTDSVLTLSPEADSFPENFDQLPIELQSMTERFLSSLTTAKVYPTPPSIEKLAELYQEFYLQAESSISTHIQELSSRQSRRDSSPGSLRSRGSTSSMSSLRKGSKDILQRSAHAQQMLTSNELYERRRARKLLEHKRIALEEAVERKVCEGLYDKIWRHRSSIDEMRDEKLRSRTEGLSVIGVGLKELGIDLVLTPEAEQWIEKARSSLCGMDICHYPLGKLKSLAVAHQNIVEMLTSSHQASSSADEILPTLIYVLIGSPVERMNLVSNLNFVQRFRTASKMNGEAAYCLTNLEAAITFLETVDLASVGHEEDIPMMKRSSSPNPPIAGEKEAQSITDGQRPPLKSTNSQTSVNKGSKPPSSLTIEVKRTPPPSPGHKRPLSALFQPQAALGAAGDAVRLKADEGFRSIGQALDKSFNFMFGRLQEHSAQNTIANPTGTIVIAPKTLDDARKLVSPKSIIDEDGLLSESSSITETDDLAPPKEDRILDMIAGSRTARDHSTDSAGSATSERKRAGPGAESRLSVSASGLSVSPPSLPGGAVESMRSLGNTLNPLNRFAGMSMMKGFGRAAAPAVGGQPTPPAEASKELGTATTSALQSKVDPPMQQFLDISDPQQLRISDVAILLKDYQRLAEIIKARGIS